MPTAAPRVSAAPSAFPLPDRFVEDDGASPRAYEPDPTPLDALRTALSRADREVARLSRENDLLRADAALVATMRAELVALREAGAAREQRISTLARELSDARRDLDEVEEALDEVNAPPAAFLSTRIRVLARGERADDDGSLCERGIR